MPGRQRSELASRPESESAAATQDQGASIMRRGMSQQSPGDGDFGAVRARGRVVVAIPCFNEERFIGSVVLKAREYADQVMVIDDGSSDRTAWVAEQAGATVIRHEFNQGKAAAVNTALEYARNSDCNILVLLDGDGQHEPADIPSLLKPITEGEADIVVGSRFLGVKSHIPRMRALGQRVLTFATNVGADVKLTDSQSGFRAFSRKTVEALSFGQKGFSVESEMQFRAKESNLRMREVPVGVAYYGRGKRSPVGHGTMVLGGILRLISGRIPLVFFGVPGGALLAIGVLQGWRVVQGYNATGDFYMGPALLAVLFCILGSLSLFTGLILHAIKSVIK